MLKNYDESSKKSDILSTDKECNHQKNELDEDLFEKMPKYEQSLSNYQKLERHIQSVTDTINSSITGNSNIKKTSLQVKFESYNSLLQESNDNVSELNTFTENFTPVSRKIQLIPPKKKENFRFKQFIEKMKIQKIFSNSYIAQMDSVKDNKSSKIRITNVKDYEYTLSANIFLEVFNIRIVSGWSLQSLKETHLTKKATFIYDRLSMFLTYEYEEILNENKTEIKMALVPNDPASQ